MQVSLASEPSKVALEGRDLILDLSRVQWHSSGWQWHLEGSWEHRLLSSVTCFLNLFFCELLEMAEGYEALLKILQPRPPDQSTMNNVQTINIYGKSAEHRISPLQGFAMNNHKPDMESWN